MAKRNSDSAAFSEAVEASAAHDEFEGTGVIHEGGGPVILVNLTESEHRKVGDELAATLLRIEERQAEKKLTVKEFKDEIADLEARRDSLRDEWVSGQRKEPAQVGLPGVDS